MQHQPSTKLFPKGLLTTSLLYKILTWHLPSLMPVLKCQPFHLEFPNRMYSQVLSFSISIATSCCSNPLHGSSSIVSTGSTWSLRHCTTTFITLIFACQQCPFYSAEQLPAVGPQSTSHVSTITFILEWGYSPTSPLVWDLTHQFPMTPVDSMEKENNQPTVLKGVVKNRRKRNVDDIVQEQIPARVKAKKAPKCAPKLHCVSNLPDCLKEGGYAPPKKGKGYLCCVTIHQ